MDILYTVEEKYLQALEELNYGELPKALHLFHEIVIADPDYARAYYQLGSFYYYQFKDYQTAGYYYKKCIALDASFPDVYEHYLKLLIVLKKHKVIPIIAETALLVPGVCRANIYESLGLYAEEQQDFLTAKQQYNLAVLSADGQTEDSLYQNHLKRIHHKQNAKRNVVYTFQV